MYSDNNNQNEEKIVPTSNEQIFLQFTSNLFHEKSSIYQKIPMKYLCEVEHAILFIHQNKKGARTSICLFEKYEWFSN